MVGVTTVRQETKGRDTKGSDLSGKRFGPGLCGPPWAPSPYSSTNGFAGKNPLDDLLGKIKEGMAKEPIQNGRRPRVMSDSMADFIANTFAAVNGAGKQSSVETK